MASGAPVYREIMLLDSFFLVKEIDKRAELVFLFYFAALTHLPSVAAGVHQCASLFFGCASPSASKNKSQMLILLDVV
jgi:hypothetical protein